jgi:hypothetical protein
MSSGRDHRLSSRSILDLSLLCRSWFACLLCFRCSPADANPSADNAEPHSGVENVLNRGTSATSVSSSQDSENLRASLEDLRASLVGWQDEFDEDALTRQAQEKGAAVVQQWGAVRSIPDRFRHHTFIVRLKMLMAKDIRQIEKYIPFNNQTEPELKDRNALATMAQMLQDRIHFFIFLSDYLKISSVDNLVKMETLNNLKNWFESPLTTKDAFASDLRPRGEFVLGCEPFKTTFQRCRSSIEKLHQLALALGRTERLAEVCAVVDNTTQRASMQELKDTSLLKKASGASRVFREAGEVDAAKARRALNLFEESRAKYANPEVCRDTIVERALIKLSLGLEEPFTFDRALDFSLLDPRIEGQAKHNPGAYRPLAAVLSSAGLNKKEQDNALSSMWNEDVVPASNPSPISERNRWSDGPL